MLLKEVEASITAACSLACDHCGFLVPDQPQPHIVDVVEELRVALEHLDRLGVRIRSLAIVGGEATLAPKVLTAAIAVAADAHNVDRVELVTNGLTPRGLELVALARLDRLSLSDYTDETRLADAWRDWLAVRAPDVEFVRRRHERWDRWSDLVDLGEQGGQDAYDDCWYRRHCITIERRRIFICSRIPKLGRDEEGLPLTAETALEDVHAYLHNAIAPSSCRTCTPMAGLPGIRPGIQPDDRLGRLTARAYAWFAAQQEA